MNVRNGDGGSGNGPFTTGFVNGVTDVANGVAIVPTGFTDSGKIVAAGVTGADYAIARYNPGTSGSSTTRLYVMQDANFNVTGTVQTNEQVKARYIYDPYGAKTSHNASWAVAADVDGLLQGHQGGRYDPVTGLYHFRIRDDSPTLGRWMQQDPAGYVDGPSLYQYESSGPPQRIDPAGLCSGSGNANSRRTPFDDLDDMLRENSGRGLDHGYAPKKTVPSTQPGADNTTAEQLFMNGYPETVHTPDSLLTEHRSLMR